MEKLRKRYRAELQRAKSIPHHRFSSSWVYFSKMDAMEKGPNGSPSTVSLSSPPIATVVAAPVAESFNDVDEDEENEDEDDGDEDYAYPTRDFNRQYSNRNGLRIKIPGNQDSNSSSGSGFRSVKRSFGDYDENPNPNPSYGGYKQQKYGNINSFSSPSPTQFDEGMRYGARVLKNGSNNGSAGSSGIMNNNVCMNSIMMMKNKKKKSLLGKRNREERGDDDAAMEMVGAIQMLGEGFVRMEKMKMEMMRETERMRMEMEMKRTEMILESQHRIVEAFAKGWADSKKSKKDAS